MGEIEHVLLTCCDCKRQVVEADERDFGQRMILNFGHTLGHAYELAGHYETYTHGQAVAAGMVAAARIGAALGVTDPAAAEAIAALIRAFGLPEEIQCPAETMAEAVGLDKKGDGAEITLILLKRLGEAVPLRMGKDAVLAQFAALCGQ